MAIFGIRKKNKEIKETPDKVISKAKTKAISAQTSAIHSPLSNLSAFNHIIFRPRITEKSGIMAESLNLYTFEVAKNSTKYSVVKAVKSLYKVNPIKIRMINLPAKKVTVKGKKGMQNPIKKALVYLKKGDKIEFV